MRKLIFGEGKTLRFSVISTLLCAVMVFVLSFSSGCDEGNNLSVGGSTTVFPLAEQLAGVYMEHNPDVTITVTAQGSSTGIRSAANGITDIGAASRELKGGELEMGLVVTAIARDAIAIVVHPDTEISNITLEQLRAVYQGDIINWSELGGVDHPIQVVSREEGSGTRDTFGRIVLESDKAGGGHIIDDAIFQSSNGAVRTVVSSTPHSIGYISLGYATGAVKIIALDGVVPTKETAISGEYALVRPLTLLTRGEPVGEAKRFIEFCLSTVGQDIVEEDYIRIDR